MNRPHAWPLTAGLAALALAAAFGSGCGGRDDEAVESRRTLIVTRAPAGEARLHPEPAKRFPGGSQLVALAYDGPGAEPRVLSDGLDAAGNPSVAIDGRSVLFVGREPGTDRFSLFTSGVDGAGRRLLVGEPFDCAGGAELPDGRVVFAAALEGALPPPDLEAAWALFVLTPDSGEVQRITFSGQTALDPYVLDDGRIVYARWLPARDVLSQPGGFALFTVHPDGTGAAALHGQHGGPGWKLRPRQAEDGDIFFLAAVPGEIGRVVGTRWTAPAETGFTLPVPASGALAVEPISEGRLLVAALPTDEDPGGLLATDRDGRVVEKIAAIGPAWDVIEAVEVRGRRRPQGQLSMIDPAGSRGLLLAIDARPAGPLGRRAAKARLRTAAAVGGNGRDLGEVDLAEDGSFFAAVPADVPLLLDVLDAAGETLVETVTPIWVRPNEVRGCIGCHEDPETAPPNRRPLAVLDDPVDLVGEES